MRQLCCLFVLGSCIAWLNLKAQPKTDNELLRILQTNAPSVLSTVLKDPTKYRCQIIYTQINRNKLNAPSFKNYYFNYDPSVYYNPASMVKMPLAFLSLEKLNQLKIKGVNKYTPILFDSSFPGQVTMYKDSTAANQLPSIAHFIKRAFLISENDPYNRMYQFVGQEHINSALHQKGYPAVRITRQFMGFTEEQNKHTNPIRFVDANSKLIYQQPPAYNTVPFDFNKEILLGKAYLNRADSLINTPFDFTKHNNVPLSDFQQMLQSVLFPASVTAKQQFKLTDDDRAFLLKYLSQYPSETDYPKYNDSLFYDSYVKFFFLDSTHQMPKHIRVFNKVGWAYGFLTDVSYVVDFKHNIEYMLAATIYVNSDDILNDSKYDYDEIGQPFMKQLGESVYQFEKNRKRNHTPQLNAFKIQYDQRNKKDYRKPISVVDN